MNDRTPRQEKRPEDGGLVRLGKTSQEHKSGVWAKHLQNKAAKAADNRARARGGK